jgi:hypothetical protein
MDNRSDPEMEPNTNMPIFEILELKCPYEPRQPLRPFFDTFDIDGSLRNCLMENTVVIASWEDIDP